MPESTADTPEYLPLTANGWIVLGIVSYSEEVSGYQVKKWADFGPGFFYLSPSFSQVYSELKKLEEIGLVASREALPDDTNSRNRRLYRITEAGTRALTDWSRGAPVERPVLKDPMIVRVMFGQFAGRDNLKARLDEYIEQAEIQSRQAAHYAQFAANDPYFAHVWIALRWAERYFAAERTLALELMKDIDLAADRFSSAAPRPAWFEAPASELAREGQQDDPPNTSRVR